MLASVLVTLQASAALAHEFWIRPSSFAPAPGEIVRIGLFVGDRGDVEELPRSPEHALRFELWRLGESVPIPGVSGRAPAGLYRFTAPGPATLLYQSRHTFIEIPPERFEGYLVDEGLDDVAAERLRRGESTAPGRESFARYAKSLLRVGGAGDAGFGDELGLPIEIVAQTDPSTWQPDDAMRFQVLYDGLPLADQQVKLIHLEEPELRVIARSDKDGHVEVHPLRGGPWMISSVYMRRAPRGVAGDWESFWANLSFELPSDPQ